MAAATGLTVLALTGAGCSTGVPSGPSGTGAATSPTAPRSLPDGIGKGLKYAFDAARAAGFTRLSTHDSSGRMRAQLLYTDWQVCFQTPGAGEVSPATRVDFGVVKLNESCPTSDQGLVTVTAGATMPDLLGRSARYASDVMGANAGISYRTPDGGDALVLVDSNWQVCQQTPAPGAPYGGVPVTLVVVKYSDGGCPTS